MKFDEILAAVAEAPECKNIGAMVDFIVLAEDVDPAERVAFITGYLMGTTYTLAKYDEGEIREAALDYIRKQEEWTARGWFD